VALLACFTLACAQAETEQVPGVLSVDFSVGHESASAPLIRLAPNQPLLLIDGVERKAAFFVRSAVSGMVDTALDGSTRLSVSGRLDVRRSPGTDTFGVRPGRIRSALAWLQPT
jgi:hypothetical protein